MEFLYPPQTTHQYVAGVCAILGLLVVSFASMGTPAFMPTVGCLMCFWIFTYINVSCLTVPGTECNVWGWLTLIQPICLTLSIVMFGGMALSMLSKRDNMSHKEEKGCGA